MLYKQEIALKEEIIARKDLEINELKKENEQLKEKLKKKVKKQKLTDYNLKKLRHDRRNKRNS